MFERFTERARTVVACASEEAVRMRHSEVGTAHLLIALAAVDDGIAARILRDVGASADDLRDRVVKILPEGRKPVEPGLPFTPGGRRALEEAATVARGLGLAAVDTEHILLGVAAEPKGIAVRILRELGVDGDRLRDEVALAVTGAPARAGAAAGRETVAVTIPCPACGEAIERLGIAPDASGSFAAERSGDARCPRCGARYELRYRIDWTPRTD